MMMGHGVTGSLITAAIGYWVLTVAGKEKNNVKTLGQWLGLLIVLIGLGGAACKFYSMTTGRPMGPSSIMCPFAGRQGPPSAQK